MCHLIFHYTCNSRYGTPFIGSHFVLFLDVNDVSFVMFCLRYNDLIVNMLNFIDCEFLGFKIARLTLASTYVDSEREW